MKAFLFTIFTTVSLDLRAAINCPADEKNEFNDVIKIIRTAPDGDRHCTGTVMKGGCHILTAGHCAVTDDTKATPSSFQLKSGPNSETTLGLVSQVALHPGYVKFKKNDVAVLTLSKCISGGLEIDDEPTVANSEVWVGGYGVTRLNSFTSQKTRHIGKNKIHTVDESRICLRQVMVGEDEKTLVEGTGCIPTGQDSGSPVTQNNKIKGVFVSNTQRWLEDGRTENKSCFENIQNPEIRSFLKQFRKDLASSQAPALKRIEDIK